MRLSGVFGPASGWPNQDLVTLSKEFDAGLVLESYSAGVFPMGLGGTWPVDIMGWWSPVHRGILPLDDVRVTRSLRKSARHFTTTVDAAFDRVLAGCADPRRSGGWIDERMAAVYEELFEAGCVHSIETWDASGRLVGGLYGVGVRGLFAGESMFHDPVRGRDASKVALLRLVEILASDGQERLLDVQWVTDHLATLGAVEVDRDDYLRLLSEALDVPPPVWPVGDRPPEASDTDQEGASDA